MGARGLTFVSWNCAGGIREKWGRLSERIDFDVAVLTECSPLPAAALREQEREVTQVVRRPVADSRHAKHIGVFARAPWRVEEAQQWEHMPWLVHGRVTDTRGDFGSFDVLAVWGLGSKYAGKLGYAQQTGEVIKSVLAELPADRPVVLAGDLNTPIESNKPDALVHNANVVRLRELDLLSAFSACFHTTPPGEKPTHYWRWKQSQAFHIDHVFVPFGWCDRHGFSMRIGTFEDWVATRISDHVPLLVNVPGPSAPQRKTWTDMLEGRRGPGIRGGTPTKGVSPRE
jgi:endonuclease/exonuclease/phosphatase family metal-dependent hydrolase